MRYRLLPFVLVVLFACKQSPKTEQQADIHTTRTNRHVQIPGTHLFIVPPPGFQVAHSFIGLQKDTNTLMQVYDLEGGNFFKNAADVNKESFERRGVKVLEYREMKLNNYPCKFLEAEGNPQMKMINMVFGDSTCSVMIAAVFTPGDTQSENEIKTALNSIYYDKNLKIDPFANAGFSLDVSKSAFKFARAASGMFVYTLGGKETDQRSDAPFMIVYNVPKDSNFGPEDIAKMFLSKTQQYGFQPGKPEGVPVTLNGLNGYEMSTYGTINGQKSLIYMLVLTAGEKAVVVEGIIKSDFDKYQPQMQQLARSIQLK